MQVIRRGPKQLLDCHVCESGLSISVEDLKENPHDGGYFVNCPVCGAFIRVEVTSREQLDYLCRKFEIGH